MDTIQVLDKTFVISIRDEEIQEAVSRLAQEISRDYRDKNPLFLVMLNGAFVFAADLLRQVTLPCEISFVKYVSYTGMASSHQVNQLIGLGEEVTGRNIVVVEDIIDTGFSMASLLEDLRLMSPRSIAVCSLLFKPDAFRRDFRINYLGLSIPNDFIVGYGLDYDRYGRNYKDIYKVAGN